MYTRKESHSLNEVSNLTEQEPKLVSKSNYHFSKVKSKQKVP